MPLKQVILARTDLKMGKGKLAVQCAHASLEAFKKALRKDPQLVSDWQLEGQAKVVLKVGSQKEALDYFNRAKGRFPVALIKDAGLTQLTPGTITCVGIGPAEVVELDKITGKLKLM
jgi:PTH2 family peptidyl-tRNA hydrolase